MRILAINSSPYLSTGTIAKDILKEARKHGHETYFAYGRRLGCKNIEEEDYLINKNFISEKFNVLLTKFHGGDGFFNKKATKKLLNYIDKIKPNIIHLHNLHGSYINIELLFGYLRKHSEIKVLWLLHDFWAISGKCPHFAYAQCEKYKLTSEQCSDFCPLRKTYPKSYFSSHQDKYYQIKKLLYEKTNINICCLSNYAKSILLDDTILGNKEIYVIPNGVDFSVFKYRKSDLREELNIKDKRVIVGSAALWTKEKGIAVFNELAERLPDYYQIILIGEVSSPVNKKIITLGLIRDKNELAKIYSCSDILLTPSLRETYSLVPLESMACGTPVIGYSTAVVEGIINNDNGIVVEPSISINNLINTIVILNEKKLNRQKVRESIKNNDINLIYKKYIQIYEELLNGKE